VSTATAQTSSNTSGMRLVPLAPFIAWFDERVELLRQRGATNAIAQVVAELGWPEETGARRIQRWRHENARQLQEIEDPLNRAEVQIWELYLDPQPFLDWLETQSQPGKGDLGPALRQLGLDELTGRRMIRQLRRYTLASREQITSALRHADIALNDIYQPPTTTESITAYCPGCRENVVPMDDERCGWCDTPTRPAA
jgi:erythromycin esterase-like protein